ncbi:MAG: hypothetical protein LBR10_13530, partial [Prevotellaceae bacterium]|nr:hypothetical protein [Prevotellaceae bacterium]
GLDNNGTWSYPDDKDKAVEKNITVSSSKYAGARIFNAQQAYADAKNAAYNVAGKSGYKVFKFKFTSATGLVREFKIVVN